MKENKFDRVTDIVIGRANGAMGAIRKEFKNTNPYRQEPIDSRERLYDYMQIPPEQIEFARQNFDPLVVDKYIADMEALKKRMGVKI